jgi:hypothetical protein
MSGATVSSIAIQERVSRQWASHEANTPAVQGLLVSLVDERRAGAAELFDVALDAIHDALHARKTALDKYGVPQDLGPDHYATLTAVKRLVEIMTVGRPVPKAVEETDEQKTRNITIEDVARLLEEHGKRQQ